MSTRSTLCLLLLPMFAGCQYLPHTDYFVAPANEPNPAWIRVVNFTQHAAIYQSANGVKTGAWSVPGLSHLSIPRTLACPKLGKT
jgi:hypothetical protein